LVGGQGWQADDGDCDDEDEEREGGGGMCLDEELEVVGTRSVEAQMHWWNTFA